MQTLPLPTLIGMLAQIVAVLVAVFVPFVRLWSRVQALEAKSQEHEEEIGVVSGVGERLARIEAKLDILMDERKR